MNDLLLDQVSLADVMAYENLEFMKHLEETLGATSAVAQERFDDMKRFLYLCAVTEEALVPTDQIDEIWHKFILFTADYSKFCETYFGSMIHHRPWSKSEVAGSDWTIVRRTRDIAERAFGATLSANWDYDIERGNKHPTCSDPCFPAGTAVLLADGTTRPIEQISTGDVIAGFDGSKIVPVRVEAIESPISDHFCVLSFGDGSVLKLTQDHPLYTSDGWKSVLPSSRPANEASRVVALEVGDAVLTATDEYKILVGIEYIAGRVQTFNITRLSRHDSFYVDGFLARTKAVGPRKASAAVRDA